MRQDVMMHRHSTNVAVLDCEISEIRLLLERHAGVLLERPTEALHDSIADYLVSHHMTSSSDLVGLLRSAPSECDRLAGSLLAGDTAFFRCPAAFEALEKKVIPEIKTRKIAESPRSLRLWSAGCSTGEEAYSAAISVCEALQRHGGGWNIHIVATDIRSEALATAARGLYDQRAIDAVPRHLVPIYFSRIGAQFLVKPRLRNLVTFAPMNLAQASFIGRFDCIFCMDVLPHFSMTQRAALLQRLHLYLEPGGYLFLGQNEKLPAAEISFTPQTHLACTYYRRPLTAAARSGRQ
jgi:chemotaxis methyl-accepting protein methylase